MQTAHAIGLSLYAYANDNQGLYPDGTSSTEVFQKLLDQGYVADRQIFYVPMEGKTRPVQDQKRLKPENVCWDVTSGASAKDTNRLPLVFLTGFRVTYAAGGGIAPLKPFPPYEHFSSDSGVAVFFTDNSVGWVTNDNPTVMFNGKSFSMGQLIESDFDAHGKTYRQLTPEGVLR